MLRAVLIALLLTACAPTPFQLGREVAPPAGCTEARERGHGC